MATNKKIIIIHGLNNKPPKKLFKKWCYKSILSAISFHNIGKLPNLEKTLDYVYWADLLYDKPLDPNITNKKNSLFLDEPYINTNILPYINNNNFDNKKIFQFIKGLSLSDKFTKNNFVIANILLKALFRDLDIYYNKEKKLNTKKHFAKELFRNRIREQLLSYNNSKIAIIAHSMGSIIAFDVIKELSDIKISEFITIGSPLGIPLVRLEHTKEFNDNNNNNKIIIPQNIKKWTNIYDKNDIIPLNNNLNKFYTNNKKNFINLIEVKNKYALDTKPDHHNIFGYLQTKEVAKIVYNFSNTNIINNILSIFKKRG